MGHHIMMRAKEKSKNFLNFFLQNLHSLPERIHTDIYVLISFLLQRGIIQGLKMRQEMLEKDTCLVVGDTMLLIIILGHLGKISFKI